MCQRSHTVSSQEEKPSWIGVLTGEQGFKGHGFGGWEVLFSPNCGSGVSFSPRLPDVVRVCRWVVARCRWTGHASCPRPLSCSTADPLENFSFLGPPFGYCGSACVLSRPPLQSCPFTCFTLKLFPAGQPMTTLDKQAVVACLPN